MLVCEGVLGTHLEQVGPTLLRTLLMSFVQYIASSLTTFLDVEDGHTLHLVVRQPGQSAPAGNAGTEGSYKIIRILKF